MAETFIPSKFEKDFILIFTNKLEAMATEYVKKNLDELASKLSIDVLSKLGNNDHTINSILANSYWSSHKALIRHLVAKEFGKLSNSFIDILFSKIMSEEEDSNTKKINELSSIINSLNSEIESLKEESKSIRNDHIFLKSYINELRNETIDYINMIKNDIADSTFPGKGVRKKQAGK